MKACGESRRKRIEIRVEIALRFAWKSHRNPRVFREFDERPADVSQPIKVCGPAELSRVLDGGAGAALPGR